MRNHIFRPVIVVMIAAALFFAARHFLVPRDFGTSEKGFMYGYHRKSNEKEWENFKIKYQSSEFCETCHGDEYAKVISSPHRAIQCENCHGPALDHPENPEKLETNRTRELCLRCHAKLSYPTSLRADIKGIDSLVHNTDSECVVCHNHHHPNLEK